ncbi:type II secretion system protein GspD [Hyunsoonleella pacifica]|uniref:Type II and III secretion system protein n=1 Tax=Hyunsoonleella pacifica TaxID=1080224 RepID=A0A4Q9FM85_9FLAO|nr:type II and III secretion system protein [Hyunsoonleella pacifica]TBN11962.1 type II and III secretion system protein [Hyunsoonleella pacifica]GGD07632.1 general secretion pathway protein GspD [Hyunsoonleella pacifica]
MLNKFLYTFFFCCLFSIGFSQKPVDVFTKKLDELAKIKEGLNDNVRIDLSGLTLYDFINAIAEEHELNVSVDSNLNQLVTSNFYDVNIKDVFLFLIQKHDLDVKVINNILVFNKKEKEVIKIQPKPLKKIDVSYNENNNFLSVKLKNDSLPRVAQAITDISKKNVVLAPDVKAEKVSAYILNRPFDQVLDMMAKSNSLVLTVDENDNYYLEKDNIPKEATKPTTQTSRSRSRRSGISKNNTLPSNESGSYEIEVDAQGFLDIKAFDADAATIIIDVAEKLNINYFMYNTPADVSTTLMAKGITFDNLLDHLFTGENYTYKKTGELYLIGEHATQGLRTTELIQLENRTIETVLATLPSNLTQGLEVKEFIELNGFVVSGSKIHIQEFKDYIYEIDLVVPVIQIEVIIVQYQKSYEIQTGLQAGLNNEAGGTTSGVLFPSSDVALNATSVNGLIDAFNGLGIINLGKVSEKFYLNLKALENNSLIKLSSTPKLVTLNGHDATSSIGETNYYFEQNNRLINSGINNNILQSGTWKSTEANLSISIKPFVSKDENVTLTISVEKSSFLGRAGENAPPGKSTQKFESLVRVRNNEMVLLGGLDELENENSGTGTPLMSRIPIIKWLFSGRTKRKEKSKLHIFIKPTVTY